METSSKDVTDAGDGELTLRHIQKLAQRMASLEASKDDEIALIRQQVSRVAT